MAQPSSHIIDATGRPAEARVQVSRLDQVTSGFAGDRRERPRLLVSAYACDPTRGSEHGVGWNWARELAQHAEVWVATRENRRHAIEAWEAAHGPIGVHWVFHECPRWLLWLKKRGLGVHGYYHCWQRLLLPKARALHRELRFDAAFHLTMNGFREPGYLWKLPCRFLWGPIGGLQDATGNFLALDGARARAVERVRGVLNRLMARFSPRPRAARARASLLLAANGESLAWARGGRAGSRHIARLLEAGVSATVARTAPPDGESILWVGSDEARKNPRFALLAFALLRRLRPAATLTFVGLSTARRAELECWAREQRIAFDGVTIHARVPRAELAAYYSSAAMFWFTSYRDTSGNVLLEALAHGAPCMAFAHQGAADMLADGAGVLVPPGSPDAMLRRWVSEASRLLTDRHALSTLGARGARRVADRFSWSRKAEMVATHLRARVAETSELHARQGSQGLSTRGDPVGIPIRAPMAASMTAQTAATLGASPQAVAGAMA